MGWDVDRSTHPPTHPPIDPLETYTLSLTRTHTNHAAGARERTQGVAVMACRFNAKREKRKRNGENARKYRMKVRPS